MTAPIAAVAARRRRAGFDRRGDAAVAQRNQLRALISMALLGIWGGGALVVATTVAPAAFRVLPSRALAGAVVGQILPVLFVAGIAVGAIAVALTPRGAPMALARRLAGVGTILGCLFSQAVIGPKIAALREQIGPNLDALAVTDPLRVAFGRLHGLSVLGLGIAMIAALIGLIVSLRAAQLRTTSPDA